MGPCFKAKVAEEKLLQEKDNRQWDRLLDREKQQERTVVLLEMAQGWDLQQRSGAW